MPPNKAMTRRERSNTRVQCARFAARRPLTRIVMRHKTLQGRRPVLTDSPEMQWPGGPECVCRRIQSPNAFVFHLHRGLHVAIYRASCISFGHLTRPLTVL